MSMRKPRRACRFAALTAGATVFAASAFAAGPSKPVPALGEPVAKDIVSAWDTTIFPDGTGLPAGSGTAKQGFPIYDEKCSGCHGPEGRGETAEELIGRELPLTDPETSQTIGAYWPYATTLFDYIHRAMPTDKPGTLTADEVYALCAYLLHLDGIIAEDAVMDAKSLPKVQMPNRDGFDAIDAKPN